MILNAEAREQRSPTGAGLEHPPRQDTLTFFEGSALNYGNYLDEVWVIDDRVGVSVGDLNDGTGSDRHFYHCNTLYSVYALTDETGAIAEAVQSYDGYGKISALITGAGSDSTWFTSDDALATNPNVSAIGNPWFYTGQRVDAETGLGYHKHRYFSYDLGRWISRDPWGQRVGISLYEYAASNTTTYLDWSGLVKHRVAGAKEEISCGWGEKCVDDRRFTSCGVEKCFCTIKPRNVTVGMIVTNDTIEENIREGMRKFKARGDHTVIIETDVENESTGMWGDTITYYTFSEKILGGDWNIRGGNDCPRCSCIERLVIYGHGGTGGGVFDLGLRLEDTTFCDDCTIYLMGCMTGSDYRMEQVRQVAKNTGCLIKAVSRDIYPPDIDPWMDVSIRVP